MRTRTRTRGRAKRTQRGLALIEVMLAVAVGSVIFIGLALFYQSCRYRSQTADTMAAAHAIIADGTIAKANPFGGDWRLVPEGGVVATGLPAVACARLAVSSPAAEAQAGPVLVAVRINDHRRPEEADPAWEPGAAFAACDGKQNEVEWRLRRPTAEPTPRT